MRHWNDLHESLAAPSPFVPTCRPRSPSSSSTPGYYCSMAAALSAKQLYSIANEAGHSSNNPPQRSGAVCEETHKTDEDVATLVQRYLQPQSSSSSSSLQASPVSGMLRAGHRRLRQLAQRPKKETADPDARAEEERCQLSALQREGFLPAPVAKKAHAKKKSVDSAPSGSQSASAPTANCKSSSRRDVERIGRPWLEDPLERCTMDPLSSGRLASLEDDLSSFMDTAMSLDGITHSKPLMAAPERSPSDSQKQTAQQPSVADKFAEHASGKGDSTGASSTTPPKNSNKPSDSASPVHEKSTQQKVKPVTFNDSQLSNESKAPKPDKSAPRNTPHTLKLFPDTVPPRVSSKAAWRLSRCPPANAPLPAAPGSRKPSSLTETSKSARNVSSPVPPESSAKDSAPEQPRSAPPTTKRFADGEKEMRTHSTNHDQPSNDNQLSSLPMCDINAFPLPAPTRPLPFLPESVAADAGHDRKAGPRKMANQFKGIPRDLRPPPAQDISRPNATDIVHQNPPTPAVPNSALAGESRGDKPRPLRTKDMSVHRFHVATSDETKEQRSFEATRPKGQSQNPNRRSVEFAPRVQKNIIRGSPSAPSLHISRTRPVRPFNGDGLSPTSPGFPYKHSEPILASGSRENLQKEEVRSGQKGPLRSEYPIPSSDEEGIDTSTHKQPQRRRTNPHKAAASWRPRRVPRIEKPTQPDSIDSLSPLDRNHSLGRSSGLSQYSQSTFQSHDSRSVRSLESRIAQLERQNKVLQAALFAALSAGNKENAESILTGTLSSLLSSSSIAPSSKMTPASSMLNSPLSLDESTSESGRYPRMEKSRRDTWFETGSSSSRSSMQSSFSAHGPELEVIHDIDLDWLSDKSSVGHSLKVQA